MQKLKLVLILILTCTIVLSACSAYIQNENNGSALPDDAIHDESSKGGNTGVGISSSSGDNNTTNNNDSSNDSTSGNNSDNSSSTDKTGGSTSNDTATDNSNSDADPTVIYSQISNMSLDEKIGQLFIVGFNGFTANDEINDMIKNNHIGGVILFRNNIEAPDQLLKLVNSLKNINSKNKNSLFISVDEEGGRITRLPDQITKLPSNQAVGTKNDSNLSYRIGGLLSKELKAFGFNLDFAPVMDIFSNPQNTVIGDRAFGTGPQIVSKLGVETMRGIRNGGIIPVVKHFPGHGDTLVDSHVGVPSVNYDMKRLESFEFVPFKAAIDNNADAVMVAHILMTKIDPNYPSSMSKILITDILRKRLGFNGVVITDDMTMGAIEKNYNIGDAVVRSFQAGSDIILVCHGYDKQLEALKALKSAIKNGKITEERLNKSIFRILELKRRYLLSDNVTESVNVDEINKKIEAVLGKWYN